ncbi:hypothetical protein HOK021_16760 [Streptomyces hygroscopicus]|nr:hypothetical protein HOK021_16760 [Streptomyces hygroscopicus]
MGIRMRQGVIVASSMVAIAAGFLATPSTASAAPASKSTQTYANSKCRTWFINHDAVNFRIGPGTGYQARGLLYYPDSGVRVGSTTHWVKLRLDHRSASGLPAGTIAWVSKNYANPCLPVPQN